MRFANVLFASLIVSAMFGAALAQADLGLRRREAPAAGLTTAQTWLWQPPIRRGRSVD